MVDAFALVAAGIVFVWGVSHIIPTKQVVAGFGDIGRDNRRIITMEWVAEGRDRESLVGYYQQLNEQQLAGIEAVAIHVRGGTDRRRDLVG